MKREDVLGIFPNATDDEIDALLNRFGSELNPVKKALADAERAGEQSKTERDAALAKAAGFEQQLAEASEKIKAGMTAEELLAERQAQAEQMQREFAIKANGLDAKALFVESGFFEAAEVDELVGRVVSEDADATKAFAESIIGTVRKQREAVEKATKDELLKANPKLQGAGGGDGGVSMTRKEFLSLPYDKQLQLKADNPQIMSQLKKE
ncbi:hypothetical protein VJ923_07275 [Adlercreutzia sp. R25]|uniref:hypothetical protein n=1 Tax=Adlercreutzia shanghongiae TaxID=3111773 RepID=UPI002DBE6BB8|nr:hypothetical protein [Adlercreutzia sp. R25]MEC4272955.1 hypothetical protein [Adlercreutzia sp. R25]